MRPGFICLALHVKGNDSCYSKGQETNMAQAADHLLGWRAGQREVAPSDIHLDSDSLSSLYEQKVAVCRFGGNSVWCICPPTIPQGSANLPSLAASSKHCYLEWCISLCLLAGVDSSSPTQTHTHQQWHSQCEDTWWLTQTDTLTQTYIHISGTSV